MCTNKGRKRLQGCHTEARSINLTLNIGAIHFRKLQHQGAVGTTCHSTAISLGGIYKRQGLTIGQNKLDELVISNAEIRRQGQFTRGAIFTHRHCAVSQSDINLWRIVDRSSCNARQIESLCIACDRRISSTLYICLLQIRNVNREGADSTITISIQTNDCAVAFELLELSRSQVQGTAFLYTNLSHTCQVRGCIQCDVASSNRDA